MPTLSLKKIFATIIGIIILMNLSDILKALYPIYEWFANSLSFLYFFSPGAQAAIAVAIIVAVPIVILRIFRKEF